ncbi:hypothetical protein BKA64DRAFT_208948 [Cadophora sp. MPI-SDFR-AT-0126]|nr:hypothetical protein BKA64DRAFT_208948 [Leotiomycetes sp. MPI-SDFR-AT-0126]
MAALQDLARGAEQPREEVDLPAQGSVSLNNHITQLRAVTTQLCGPFRGSSDWSNPEHKIRELQFLALTSTIGEFSCPVYAPYLTFTIEYMETQETILKARQEQINLLYTENMALHERLRESKRDCTDGGSHVLELGERLRTVVEERKWFQTSLTRFEI